MFPSLSAVPNNTPSYLTSPSSVSFLTVPYPHLVYQVYGDDMRLNFKVVGGRSGSFSAGGQTLISEMKRTLGLELGLPSIQLTLLHKGVKLDQSRTVSQYKIENDGMITVVVSKLSPFQLKLYEHLSSQESNPEKCMSQFFIEYEKWLAGINLDQVERICRNL